MRLFIASINLMMKYIILDGKPTLDSGSIKCKRSAIYVEL